MLENIKELLKSKKFKVTVFAVLAIVFSALAGQIGWSDALEKIWPLVAVYIGAQGLADFGKAKAEIENKTGDSTGE